MISGYIYLLIMVIFTASGHICLKYFSRSFKLDKPLLKSAFQFLRPLFAAGFILMASAPFFYFSALEKLELSQAYSFTALNQIIIPASGFFLFREKTGLKKIAGIILVAAGIIIWNL